MRPRGVRDLRHQAVYPFGTVCPERGAGVALVLPAASAAATQAMLDELSQAVSPGALMRSCANGRGLDALVEID